MSEAARKDYFFLPPGRDTRWSERPPERAGLYWVLPGGREPRPEPVVLRYDPAAGRASLPAGPLLDGDAGGAEVPLERIRAWWPVPLAPPPVG